MTIERILSLFATIVSVVAVPASGYLSYLYAIKGERRKEWNALAEPVIDYFFRKAKEHGKGSFYLKIDIPFDKIAQLRRRMSSKETIAFEREFSSYVALTNKFNNQQAMTKEDKINGCKEAAMHASAIIKVIRLK